MIYLKLIGGLGNQLFQIAYAYEISKKLKKDIYVNTNSYDKYKIRNCDIEYLNIYSTLNQDMVSSKYGFFNISTFIYRIYQKLLKTLLIRSNFGKFFFNTFSKIGLLYNFDPYFYNVNLDKVKTKNVYIYGYFQSEHYFKNSKNEIKELLKINSDISQDEQNYLDNINNEESIAISMRLGDDYFDCEVLNVCNEKFYVDALTKIIKKTGVKAVFVFSDDIDKAQLILNKFDGVKIEFVIGMSPVQSLRLMYHCSHFVIGNSSFSWWGSYLSDNKNKIVVTPDKWYNTDFDIPDVFFENMIKVRDL